MRPGRLIVGVGQIACPEVPTSVGQGPVPADQRARIDAGSIRGAGRAISVTVACDRADRALLVGEQQLDAAGARRAVLGAAAQPDAAARSPHAQTDGALPVESMVTLGADGQTPRTRRPARSGDAGAVDHLGASGTVLALTVVGAGLERLNANIPPADFDADAGLTAIARRVTRPAAIAQPIVVEADAASAVGVDRAFDAEVIDAAPRRARQAVAVDAQHGLGVTQGAVGVGRAGPAHAIDAQRGRRTGRVRYRIAAGAAAADAARSPRVESSTFVRVDARPTDRAVRRHRTDRRFAGRIAAEARWTATLTTAVDAAIALAGAQYALCVELARPAALSLQIADGGVAVLGAAGVICRIARDALGAEALRAPDAGPGRVTGAERIVVVAAVSALSVYAGPIAHTGRAVDVCRALGARRVFWCAAGGTGAVGASSRQRADRAVVFARVAVSAGAGALETAVRHANRTRRIARGALDRRIGLPADAVATQTIGAAVCVATAADALPAGADRSLGLETRRAEAAGATSALAGVGALTRYAAGGALSVRPAVGRLTPRHEAR